jgi:hypothetical protein
MIPLISWDRLKGVHRQGLAVSAAGVASQAAVLAVAVGVHGNLEANVHALRHKRDIFTVLYALGF